MTPNYAMFSTEQVIVFFPASFSMIAGLEGSPGERDQADGKRAQRPRGEERPGRRAEEADRGDEQRAAQPTGA